MKNKLKHLDLGCGVNPKNPYNSKYLFGIDIEILDKSKIQSNATIKDIKARNLIFDSTKSDGQYIKPSDNSKLKLIMSDFNFTTVNEGISKTINWYQNNS